MARFRKSKSPAFGAAPNVRAAAGGARQIGALYSYQVGAGVQRASSIPTLSRALNLLVSVIAGLDLEQYQYVWNGEEYEELVIPGESWMDRPDPSNTRQFVMGATVADLFWHGRAFWYIQSRYATNGRPASFAWLPFANVNMMDDPGPWWFGQSKELTFNGEPLDPANVLQFISPTPGVLSTGARMIDIATRLDEAARRFSTNEIAAGYLQQEPNSEPMTTDELGDLAAAWADARSTNAIGALNALVKYVSFDSDPSKLQLTEGREYSALELSRIANVPPYLLGISTGGMTYQNAQEAMKQLVLLGARPIMQTIEETLSLDSVVARGRHVRFDVDDIFGELEPEMPEPATMPNTPDMSVNPDVPVPETLT